MKNATFFLLVFLSLFAVAGLPQSAAAQDDDLDFTTFYNELSPYGQWVNTAQYGEAWAYNEPGFRPYYSNGNWEYTEEGWSWNSGYSWGWAAFHYGRWEYDADYGWLWIPGYDWAPAWVSWSETGDYYGWAPLGYRSSLSLSYNSIPYERWSFIPRRYIGERQLSNYYVPYSRVGNYGNLRIINNQYHENNRRFFRGPDLREAQRYTSNRIESRPISMGRPSGRNTGRDWNAAGRETDRRFNREPIRMPQQNSGFGGRDQQRADNNFGGNREQQRGSNGFPGNGGQQRTDNNFGANGVQRAPQGNNSSETGREQRTPQAENSFGRNRDQQRNGNNFGGSRDQQRAQQTQPAASPESNGNTGNNSRGFGFPSRESTGRSDNPSYNGNQQPNRDFGGQNNNRTRGFSNETPHNPVNNDQPGRQSAQPRFEQRNSPEPAPSGGQPRNYGNDGNRGGRPQRGHMN